MAKVKLSLYLTRRIVKLKLKFGKVFEVDVDKLSNNDRQHIQSLKSTISANDNTHTIRKYNIDKLELLYSAIMMQ